MQSTAAKAGKGYVLTWKLIFLEFQWLNSPS